MPRTRTRRTTTPSETIQDNAAIALHSTVTIMQDLLVRVITLADEGKSLKELLQILETVGKTSNRLSTLLKNQKALAGEVDLAEFLNEALADVVRELGEGTVHGHGLSK